MAFGTKKCKVCGAEYEYCRTKYQNTDIFRYQDVACSPEHGSIYFAKVMASRAKTTNDNVETKKAKSVKTESEENDEYDELFEEDFDDDDLEELEIET